jgi:hypothetical protein
MSWPSIPQYSRVEASPHSSSAGTSITAAASADTKGSYSQIIASTAFDAHAMLLHVGRETGTAGIQFLIDLAVGGAGSEQIIIPNYLFSRGNNESSDAAILLPISIPAGSRIAARCQCSTASAVVKITLHLFGGDLWTPGGLSRVEACGAVTTDSGGSGIDPGASANTKGAYGPLITSTAFDYKGIFVCIGGNKNSVIGTLTRGRMDISVGPSSSEQVILPDLQFVAGTAGDAYMPGVYPFFPIAIPAGSRIAVRAQSSNTDATDRIFDVVVYGVG